MNNYEYLIQQLDAFIRKFYLNKLIKGSLIFLSCILIYLLIIGLGEYYFYFPSWLKWCFVVILFVLGGTALVYWMIIPVLQLRKIGHRISHQQAAVIVGKHFSQVKDKLINILQLNSQSVDGESKALIVASVEQKAKELSIVPFKSAISFKKNKKYAYFVLPPLLILLAFFLASPAIFKNTSERLFQPNKNFEKPAPFSFELMNENMQIAKFEPIKIKVKIKGEFSVKQVFLVLGSERLNMNDADKDVFEFELTQLAGNTSFYFEAEGYKSQKYTIQVVERPVLNKVVTNLNYPKYVGKEDEIIQGISDIDIPIGTIINWKFTGIATDEIKVKWSFSDQVMVLSKKGNEFSLDHIAKEDAVFTLYLSSKDFPNSDSFTYAIKTIPDLIPQLNVEHRVDSITQQQVLFIGNASDDYGLQKVTFQYVIKNADNQLAGQGEQIISKSGSSVVNIDFYYDLKVLQLHPGQYVEYFIQACDNDYVKGSKCVRSNVYTYKMLEGKELNRSIEETTEQLNKGVQQSSKNMKNIQEEMQSIKSDLLQRNTMSWEKEQQLKSVYEKQLAVKKQLEQLKKKLEELQKKSEQKEVNDGIKDKQEALKDQIDQLMNKQLEEQLKKIQEMLQEKNKDKAIDQLNKLEQNNQLFNMDLERVQALMKQLEMQMKMEDMANAISDLAEREDQLNEKHQDNNSTKDALIKEQKEIQKDLNKVMKEDMKELEEMSKEQNKQEDLKDEKDLGNDANEDMQDSQDGMQENKKEKADKAQKNAAQKLKQMAAKMQSKAKGMDMEQIELDIKATRQILSNLLRYSFAQEELLKKVRTASREHPQLIEYNKQQSLLRSNARMIKDSLFNLSKRVHQLSASVNKETSALEFANTQAIAHLEERRTNESAVQQQYAMTYSNNLALLLNELLENLISEQIEGMDGEGKEGQPNPGGQKGKSKSKGSSPGGMMKDIITGQQKLGEGLGKMQSGQSGKDKGAGKEGQSGNEGSMNAQEISQLAREQSMLRKQIQELNSMLNSKGIKGNAKLLKEVQEQMDKLETDLVHKRIKSDLLLRQKEILTKLLKAEESIREQEEDNKRVANAAKEVPRTIPDELKKFQLEMKNRKELYQTSPPKLKPYYKRLTDQYFNSIQ